MKIAIVGAGISGLSAAHLLYRDHHITVYESNGYAGGHTNTVRVESPSGPRYIDTGFIVMNDRNYPNFTRLLDGLGVPRQPTYMSFSVKAEGSDFEYSGTPRGLFSQRRNLASPAFWGMLRDLPRFNRELRRLLAGEETGQSLSSFCSEHGFSRTFQERLIVPQLSAVWSADPAQMDSFPVRFLAEFLANHGMLGFVGRPHWSTVVGGSARYVQALTRPFGDQIRLNCPVQSITRQPDRVEIRVRGCEPEHYDQVLIATHSDQALAMLSDASAGEREVLGAIPYQQNEAVLHTDGGLLPRRQAARAAWNFHLLSEPRSLATVTYYMNHLQAIAAPEDYCVTLNHAEAIDPRRIIRKISYAHPVFTPAGVAAQSQHHTISGMRTRTHYCGAYWGWGFHEDGVVSALRVCDEFGVSL
ncbi:MAG TPA: FAD-dependent oxidoreductase [Solirubrobacteraceae bacterium]